MQLSEEASLSKPEFPIPGLAKDYTDFRAVAVNTSCRTTFESNGANIESLKKKMRTLNRSTHDTVIIIANASDVNGKQVLNLMLPDHDRQRKRNENETFVVAYLARKILAQEVLFNINENKAKKLLDYKRKDLAVIVFDCGVVEIFTG